MKKLLIALTVLLCATRASAQPVPPSWRPPINCSTGVALTWNGTIWSCGAGGAITGTLTSGRSVRATGTSTVSTGAFTDDGTNAVAQGTLGSVGNFTSQGTTNILGGTVTPLSATALSVIGNGVFVRANAGVTGVTINLTHTRGADAGTHGLVSNGDTLANINFNGSDGSASVVGTQLLALVNGATSAGVVPTDFVIKTTATNSAGLTEAMRIASNQAITMTNTLGVTGLLTATAGVQYGYTQQGTLADGYLDNWAPTGLTSTGIAQVTAADNQGTVVTGIDATGIAVGRRITVCNANGPQDDSVLAFEPESSRSTAAYRIWTPSYGKNESQTATERYIISPSACVDLIYMQPNQSDSSVKRWLVVDTNRFGALAVNQLGIYPESNPSSITGTVNNWDPADNAFGAGLGEAGTNTASTARTLIRITTTDGTGAIISGIKYTGSQTADGQGPIKILCNTGPGPVTLYNGHGSSDGINLMTFGAGSTSSDVVLDAGGSCVMLWHKRDTGTWIALGKYDYYFGARDVTMTKGLAVSTDSTTVSATTITGPTSGTVPALWVTGYNTDGNADTMRVRSGDTSRYVASSIGRTSLEATWGVAASSNHFMTGTAAGDSVISTNGGGRKLFLGTTLNSTPTCTLTGTTIDCATITEGASAVLSGTISANVIPKGSSGNLVDSTISDDGTGLVTVAHVSGAARFTVGDATDSVVATANGFRITAFSDDNQYIDSKVGNGGTTNFRTGHNTEAGTTRTWLTVTGSSGAASFPFNLSTDANLTAGNATTDRHTVTGSLRNITGNPASVSPGASWGDNWLVVGPNAASDTGAAVGLSYNTTDGVAALAANQPGTDWLPMIYGATYHRFNIGTTQTFTVTGSEIDVYKQIVDPDSAVEVNDTLAVSGQIFAGDTASSAIANNVDVLTIGNTGTGQTTSGTALISASHSGSFNTTGGDKNVYGSIISVSATESAGSNILRNVALKLSATGGDDAIALHVDDGYSIFASYISVYTKIELSGNLFIGQTNTDSGAHIVVDNDAAVAPAASSCGTTPSVNGGDTAGVVTVGTGTATSCTITFDVAYNSTPACVVTSDANNANPLYFSAKSASAFTVTTSAGTNLASQTFNYVCIGKQSVAAFSEY